MEAKKLSHLPSQQDWAFTEISLNKMKLYDSVIPLADPTLEGSFYSVERSYVRPGYAASSSLYEHHITLSSKKLTHSRHAYDLFNLLGDLGGMVKIITLGFALFLLPISEHSFYLRAIESLFTAVSAHRQDYFDEPNDSDDL